MRLIDVNLNAIFPDYLSERTESVKNEKTTGKCFVCGGKELVLYPEKNRNVAQLVAYYVRDVGVGRSSRLIPTILRPGSLRVGPFCLILKEIQH